MGCPCDEQSSPNSVPSNSLGKYQVMEPVYISKSKLASLDKKSLLQFAHCTDKPSFDRAFGPYFPDNDFTESDFEKLASLWESGEDRANGFSIERIFGSISTNLRNLKQCSSIKWTD